jgi:hypothetical protein
MDFKFFIGRQFELEPTQLSSLRRNDFKFFHGLVKGRTTVLWIPETDGREYYNIEEQLTRRISREIANEIDNGIMNRLTHIMGDGANRIVNQIVERNVNADYLQRYLDMGENRA